MTGVQTCALPIWLEYMGVDGGAVEKNVDEVMGLPAIIALTSDAETKLFI